MFLVAGYHLKPECVTAVGPVGRVVQSNIYAFEVHLSGSILSLRVGPEGGAQAAHTQLLEEIARLDALRGAV